MMVAKILIVRISSMRYVSGENKDTCFHSPQIQSLTPVTYLFFGLSRLLGMNFLFINYEKPWSIHVISYQFEDEEILLKTWKTKYSKSDIGRAMVASFPTDWEVTYLI